MLFVYRNTLHVYRNTLHVYRDTFTNSFAEYTSYKSTSPREDPGVNSRMYPPYPQRVEKGD